MDNVQMRYLFDRKKEANSETKKGLLQIEVRTTLRLENQARCAKTGLWSQPKRTSPWDYRKQNK
jgi:hypothetical protein